MIDAIVFAVIGLVIVAPVLFYLYRHLRPVGRLLKNADVIRPPESRRSSVYERANLRLGIALISANVLALLLISIVGFSQLGMDWWRLHSGERAHPSTPALEELLRSRLPDQETLKQQHKEVIEAIKEVPSSGPTTEPDDALRTRLSSLQSQIARLEAMLSERPARTETVVETPPAVSAFFSLASSFILFGLLMCAGAVSAVLYFLQANGFLSKKSYGIATAALTVGSLWGGVTMLKDFSLVKSTDSLLKFEFKSDSSTSKTPVDVHLHLDVQAGDSSRATMDCGEGDSRRIGPFDDGTVTVSEQEGSRLKTIAEAIAGLAKQNHLTAIMLIGSADKRPLKPKTAELYNSNEGLAQARIKRVRKALEDSFGAEKPPIMESYAGPSKTNVKLSVGDLASDRAVQICVFWTPKPEPR